MRQFFLDWQPFFEACNGFATAALTICVLLLAREQNHLARTQARIDVQGRRLALFDVIMAFLAHITMHGTTDPEELRRMLRETRHAPFLFPRKARIMELVSDLYLKGLELERLEKEILSFTAPDLLPVRKDLIQKSYELKDWFKAKRTEIEDQFRPYLAIEEE